MSEPDEPTARGPAQPQEQAHDGPRREERVTINKEFESYDAFLEEYVTNVSRSGAFVRSKTPLAVGTRVNLEFTVIGEDLETIVGEGEVVRVQDDPPGMGVVFTTLDERSQGIIDRLVERSGGAFTAAELTRSGARA